MEYSKDPDIRAIEIIDPDNMIVASQNPDQIGRVLQDQQWLDMKSQQREVASVYRMGLWRKPSHHRGSSDWQRRN